MKAWPVYVVLALLLGSVFVLAAKGASDAEVQAAVQAELNEGDKGFVDERVDDIKDRLDPSGSQSDSKDFPRSNSPRNYPADAFGPNGPNNFGPGGPGPQGYGGYDDYDDDDESDYGPRGPRVGPHDYRAFGGFEGLPDEFVGFAVFDRIGEKMMQKYGEENLKAKCDNQPELVDLVLKEVQQSGLNLREDVCSEMERGLEYCEEGKKQCESIGDNEFGPRFGPPGEEEEFKFSCPPDKEQVLAMCKNRMAKEFDRGFSEREEDLDDDCEVRWEFEQGHFQNQCEGGQIRLPEFCSKDKFISQCLERSSGFQPHDQYPQEAQSPYGYPGQPGQEGGYPGQGQYPQSTPYARQCPPGPQLPQAWYDNCKSTGGNPEKQTDRNGCVINVVCNYRQTTSPTGSPYRQTGTYCPSDAERQQAKNTCTSGGGTWSENSHDGCIYVNCQGTSGTQPSPTYYPTAYPSPSGGPSPTAGATCPSLDEAYKQSCLNGGGTVSTVQQSGCTYYQCQYPTAPSPTAGATCPPLDESSKNSCTASGGTVSTVQQSGCTYYQCQYPTAPSPSPFPSPTGEGHVSSAPFTAFLTGQISASERCEQEWQQQQPRFERECSRIQQQGPGFNPCSKDSFVAFCRQQQQEHMQKERGRINFGRICELESKRMLRDLERYCRDTSRGKEQCLRETERGCEFGRKQFQRCQELTAPDKIRPAIEKAVARGCQEFRRGDRPDQLRDFEKRASELQKVRDLIPPSLQPLLDFESDNVAETDENLQKVNQKDVLYALTQIIGLQAEQERKDAQLIKEQSERLAGTIERLKQLREQVDDANAAAILDAQILDLEEQRVSLGARAESKEQGAAGILSFLANLFGGG